MNVYLLMSAHTRTLYGCWLEKIMQAVWLVGWLVEWQAGRQTTQP